MVIDHTRIQILTVMDNQILSFLSCRHKNMYDEGQDENP